MNFLAMFLMVVVIAIFWLRFFRKIHLLDKPGSDLKNTRKPVPTLQGIFVILAFLIGVACFMPDFLNQKLFWGLLIPGVLIGIVELIEELSYLGKFPKIPPIIRLIVHCAGAVLAVLISGIGNQELVIWELVFQIPHWLFVIGFVVWTMFCINAINRFDGIYAQGSGVSAIWFLTLFLLIQRVVFQNYDAFPNYDALIFVQKTSLLLFIVALVYAVIEYKPLGLVRDVGIMFFGFALAYLSIAGGAKIGTLIVALSLPIFDAIWVGLWRIFVMKKNPLNGDYTHLHHRLMGIGFSRGETRAFIRIWSAIMMVLMLLQGTDRISKIIIFLMMAMLFFGLNAYLFLYKKLPCGLQIQKER